MYREVRVYVMCNCVLLAPFLLNHLFSVSELPLNVKLSDWHVVVTQSRLRTAARLTVSEQDFQFLPRKSASWPAGQEVTR